jgi:shikimate dehydrogenase
MRFFGLIGYPLDHSFSEAYFKEKFKREGINAQYRNFPLESIDQFKDLVSKYPDLNGINVTIPYKESILPFLDALSQTARAVKAVNTICFCRKDKLLALVGHNTDIIGFRKSLEENLVKVPSKAMVLGTGGSAKAVIHVLKEMELKITRVSRTAGEGRLTYQELNKDMVAEHLLIVNTTPLGMYPDTGSAPEIPYEGVGKDHLLFDLVYNPPETKFLSMGKTRQARIVNGTDMLTYQAEAAWDIWNRNPKDTLDL